MSFKDGQNSVKSLLDLLKNVPESSTSNSSTAPWPSNPSIPASSSIQAYSTQNDHYNPHNPSAQYNPYATSSIPISSVNPTQRQLDELLASLQQNNSASNLSSGQSGYDGGLRRSSSISHSLPIQNDIRKRSFDHTSLQAVSAVSSLDRKASEESVGNSSRRPQGWETMSFTKALPIISSLLEKEDFKKELKKDGLERRLWAKQEKLKADLDKPHQAEREVRRSIPATRQAEWDKELQSALRSFYLGTVLPSLDGIAQKHTLRLEELGIPGLGGGVGGGTEGEERMKRIKRIMGVLQAGMEE